MVSSTPESEWDDEQQAWMIALATRRADLHVCGQPLSESADPANEGRYEAELPVRCHACTAMEIKQQDYQQTPQPSALLWRVRRR